MKLENLFRALILFPFVLMPIYWFVDFSVFIQIVDSNIDVKHLKDLALQPEPSIATGALMLVWLFIASGMMFFFKKRAREVYLGWFIYVLGFDLLSGLLTGSFWFESDAEGVLDELDSLSSGMVIALAYFSPLKERFKPKP
tara:strand:+ start:14 stop:436 length:423 start_codon:yes stop_codon:yes gene_type:complete